MNTVIDKRNVWQNPWFLVAGFLLLSGIFLLPAFIDLWKLEQGFHLRWNDNDIGWFGLGISWLSARPRINFHHPSLFFNALSGLLVLMVKLDGTHKALESFLNLTFWFQTLVALAVSAYSAWLIRTLRLPLLLAAVSALLTALMPTSIVYAAHFGNYFFLVLLSFPAGLLAYGWLTGQRKTLVPLFAILGFLSANFYPFLILTCIFLAVVISSGLLEAREHPTLSGGIDGVKRHRGLALLMALTVGVPTLALIVTVAFIQPPSSLMLRWVIPGMMFLLVFGAPVALLAINGAIKAAIPEFRKSLWALFLGWWAGAHILAPFYLTSLIRMLNKSGKLLAKPAHGGWATIIEKPWFWLVFLVAAALLIAAMRWRKGGPGKIRIQEIRVVSFIIISFPVLLLAGFPYFPLSSSDPGMGMRLMIPLIVPLIVSLCYVFFHLNRAGQLGISSLVAIICILGLVRITEQSGKTLEQNRMAGIILDDKIKSFLEQNPQGKIICARDETYSKICATAYAYNRYQTRQSRKRLSTRNLYNGRVIWLSSRELQRPLKTYLNAPGKPVLIVGELDRLKTISNPDFKIAKPILTTRHSFILRLN